MEYLHFSSTSCRWFCSWCSSCWLEHSALALWLLSHCRYWSVWVCFLCTVVAKVPSGYGITSVSRNGIESSGLVSSTVNWICGSFKLMNLSTSLLQADFCIIHIPFPQAWRVGRFAESLGLKTLQEVIGHYGAYIWPHSCPF